MESATNSNPKPPNGKCRYYCGKRRFQYFASVSATVGAFSLGSVLAWPSPAIPNMETTSTSSKYYIDMHAPETKAWIASIATLGACVSGPLAGFLMTRIGIKTTMLLITSPFILGWLLMAYSKSLFMMLCGRVLTGFCGGAISLLAPIFIGENVQPCHRGLLASGFQVMVVSGILFAYVFGAFLSWQWLSIACGLVPLIFIIFMIFMPESPRYLTIIGQEDDAASSLCWLRGTESTELIQDELKAIQQSVQSTHQTSFTFHELCSNPKIYKPTLIVTFILVFQQFSGINTVIFFTSDLVRYTKVQLSPDIIRIIIGGLQPITTILSAFLVDRQLGRRGLLMISGFIMFISHIVLGTYIVLVSNQFHGIENFHWIPTVSLICLVSGFGLGFGGIPWVLASELLHRRGLHWTSPIPNCCHWASAFVVTMFFESLGRVTALYWIYYGHGLVCGVASIYIYFMLPETKCKSLDEIQDLF